MLTVPLSPAPPPLSPLPPKLRDKRTYLSIISLVVMCGGLVASLVLVQRSQEIRKKAAGPATVPTIRVGGPGTVQVGQPYTAAVSVDTGLKDISAVDVVLTFPTDKLTLQDIRGYDVTQSSTSLKTFNPLNSEGTGFDEESVIAGGNDSGVIKFGAVTFDSATGTTTSPFNSSGVALNLLTLNFLVKSNASPGAATIGIDYALGSTIDSNLVPTDGEADILGVTSPLTFQITAPPPNPLRVFVTSKTYQGNLGGLAGADSKCQTLASAAGLNGTFKAWLSTSTTNAKDRLTKRDRPYYLVRSGGALGAKVANNFADLTDGTISAAISVNQKGVTVSFPIYAWTGTDRYGVKKSAGSTYCSGWTINTNKSTSRVGRIIRADYNWTDYQAFNCTYFYYLYCFED